MKIVILAVSAAVLAAGGFVAGLHDSAGARDTVVFSMEGPRLPGSAPALPPRLRIVPPAQQAG